MSYIGTIPKDTFTTGLVDRFTSTTGTTVTLTHEISSKNDIIVFVNFVKQDSTNYSVGGTGNKTLTLGGTLVSSDVVEVHYLNKVFGTQQPSANSVGVTELNLSEGTSGQALTTNGSGTLSFSSVASTNGITMANAWRLTTSFTNSSGQNDITSNWELVDTDNYSSIGSNMTESSGIFSFPSTGIYLITYRNQGRAEGAARAKLGGRIKVTTDNSSYATASLAFTSATNNLYNFCTFQQIILDVTNTTNVKVKFTSESDGSSFFDSETGLTYNGVTFIRLGDT